MPAPTIATLRGIGQSSIRDVGPSGCRRPLPSLNPFIVDTLSVGHDGERGKQGLRTPTHNHWEKSRGKNGLDGGRVLAVTRHTLYLPTTVCQGTKGGGILVERDNTWTTGYGLRCNIWLSRQLSCCLGLSYLSRGRSMAYGKERCRLRDPVG